MHRSDLKADRQLVRRLQSAYADKIESFMRGLKAIPGDPYEVNIRQFMNTRTFLAKGHEWLNRASVTGDEDRELLGEISQYFKSHGQRLHIEWNPGNCYLGDTWKDEFGRTLLALGFKPLGFRCVWFRSTEDSESTPPEGLTLRSFPAQEKSLVAALMADLEERSGADRVELIRNVTYGEASDEWRHYVGFWAESPCCGGTMFHNASTAYLQWSFTGAPYRGRGCHRAMIRQRIDDARAAGCDIVFAVTDIGTQSASNLQKLGFRLAYNYVMMVK